MDTRPKIRLPPDLIERCRAHAERIVADYDAGLNVYSPTRRPDSRRSKTRLLQAQRKHGQRVYAFAGHWPVHRAWTICIGIIGRITGPDKSGYFILSRIDIKATHANGRYLIWPIGKRHPPASPKTLTHWRSSGGAMPLHPRSAGIGSENPSRFCTIACGTANADSKPALGTWMRPSLSVPRWLQTLLRHRSMTPEFSFMAG